MSGGLDSAFEGLTTERKPGRISMQGQVGSGDGRLRAKTVSGDVTLLRRARGAGMSPVFGHGRLRLYLLKLLDESPRHGYDVIRALEDRFLGLYAPSAGTVYPRLARLETEGLVTSTDEDGRKVYRITDAGRAELAARQDELADIESDITGSVRDLATEIRTDVRGSVEDLRAELKSAARDVRRESRHQARAATRSGRTARAAPSSSGWPSGSATRSARSLRRNKPTDAEVAALKKVIEDAMDEVRRVLGGTRPPLGARVGVTGPGPASAGTPRSTSQPGTPVAVAGARRGRGVEQ